MWLVDPRLWDDKKFRQLSPIGKLGWLCLLTAPFRSSLPGLISAFSPITLAESIDVPQADGVFALKHMMDLDMVQYDAGSRVLRVPNAPRYSICRNPNILAGWFRLWGNVAECELKYLHVASIADSVNFSNEKMVDRWERTFGRVKHQLEANGSTNLTLLERMPQQANSSPELPEKTRPNGSALTKRNLVAPAKTVERKPRSRPWNSDAPLSMHALNPAQRKR